MKTFSFVTKDQRVTILASLVTGMRRLDDSTFGPRTAIDASNGAIYTIIETDEEYEARLDAWSDFLKS